MNGELGCSRYIVYDFDDSSYYPCNCPVCGGWLKWEVENDEWKPICNKCHADLIAIPDRDEELGEDLDSGKICPLSLAKKKGMIK